MRTRLLIAVSAIAVIAGVYLARPSIFRGAYEEGRYLLAPSAERAYAYGTQHFNAVEADEYDIDTAERYFRRAATLDDAYPGVHHQLARIAFLRADFPAGLGHINREIEEYGDANPNAYYIRALILGYMGQYLEAAADYETYFRIEPANWAGINDYAWVLLKADLPEGALGATEWGLDKWPDNPWLLHNKAIALYELGRFQQAAQTAQAAAAAVETVTPDVWLMAYPGNDPRVAEEGVRTFKKAVADNQAQIRQRLDEMPPAIE